MAGVVHRWAAFIFNPAGVEHDGYNGWLERERDKTNTSWPQPLDISATRGMDGSTGRHLRVLAQTPHTCVSCGVPTGSRYPDAAVRIGAFSVGAYPLPRLSSGGLAANRACGFNEGTRVRATATRRVAAA